MPSPSLFKIKNIICLLFFFFGLLPNHLFFYATAALFAEQNQATISNKAEKNENTRLQENLKNRPILQKPYIKKMMKRAEDHFFKKRYNVALKIFQLIITKDPENPLAYRYAGDIYLVKKKLKEAENHFYVARELSTQPQKEWLRLGQVHILAKKGKKAIKALETALELEPDLFLCHFYLGLAYYKIFRDKKNTIKHWSIYETKITGEEKRKIQRAIAILKQKNYSIPKPRGEIEAYSNHFEPTLN